MSNIFGKTLLGAKQIGSNISKSAKEITATVGTATANVAEHAKKAAKVAMLKAEMEQLYKTLGLSIYENHVDNMLDELLTQQEIADIIHQINEKKSELDALETHECDCDYECGCNGPCDCTCDCNECDKESCECEPCDENCDCDCHNETVTKDTEVEE